MHANAPHMRNIPVPALASPGSTAANTRSDARNPPCPTVAPRTELLDALGVQHHRQHLLLRHLRLELAEDHLDRSPHRREQARRAREPAARHSASAATHACHA